jgi:BRO family, N-terminal domain
MEQEQRKTGCSGNGQNLGAQPTAASTGAGAQAESGREKMKQFQQGSTSEERGGRPESVPAIEFSFEGRSVRNVVKDGQAWFVAADVCAVLEHPNPRQVISRLDDDEKGVLNVDTLGGAQEMNVVNESGVYNLIFTSRKPQAKAFRRWVTDEVLPSIRKTGRYQPGPGRAGSVQVALPQPGRYVVTVLPGGNLHLHQTAYEALLGDLESGDCQMLAYALKMIEGYWHEMQQMRSIGHDPESDLAFQRLEKAILEGGDLASRFLRYWIHSRTRLRNPPVH